MRISDWSSDVCSSDLFGDQPVDLGRDVLFIERFFADVEIEAAFVRTDLAARHAVRDDGAEQMQAGVHAHVPAAAAPIADGGDLRSRLRQCARTEVRRVVKGCVIKRTSRWSASNYK